MSTRSSQIPSFSYANDIHPRGSVILRVLRIYICVCVDTMSPEPARLLTLVETPAAFQNSFLEALLRNSGYCRVWISPRSLLLLVPPTDTSAAARLGTSTVATTFVFAPLLSEATRCVPGIVHACRICYQCWIVVSRVFFDRHIEISNFRHIQSIAFLSVCVCVFCFAPRSFLLAFPSGFFHVCCH